MRMGVRLYDPHLGRFVQQDPVEGGSCNDFEYTCGDPVNAMDLYGLCNSAEAWCVRGILVGVESLPTIRINGQTFGQFLGSRSSGRVINANTKAGFRRLKSSGACSAPRASAFFFDFNNACKTHDLGYDLMRFIGSSGSLGSTRAFVDLLFYVDMRADCGGRGWFGAYERPCRGVADIYFIAVVVNSVAHGFSVP
ncbi:MAG: phospholipase A2 [Acidimicrobiia bacterium]|nr:phospholipase A2 [Acidimicrobiia bacterium]